VFAFLLMSFENLRFMPNLMFSYLLFDYLRVRRLRKAYRLICHINNKRFLIEDFEEFLKSVDQMYREDPIFWR